ncbi:MAG: tyrosine-type recombinase/integrase [Synergistaceae bacterium]|nr:tyrosine-type recombinase/integrase [Synergistaceae bacterium]
MYPAETTTQSIDFYLQHLKSSKNLDDKSIRAYSSDLAQFCEWFTGTGSEYIDSTIIVMFIEMLQKERRLKDSSIRRKFASLKSFFRHTYNDTSIFKKVKFKAERRLPKILSRREVVRMLKTMKSEISRCPSDFHKTVCIRDNAIIELLFCTGIRIGELVKITVTDLDMESRSILIHGKGRKQRVVFISSDQVRDMIISWLSVRDSLYPMTDHLFLNRYGRNVSIYAIENIFSKYRDLAGVNRKSTPHYLRHTFATFLVENGADIREVQELLGHSSISTTQIYTEVSVARKKEVLDRFNARNKLKI